MQTTKTVPLSHWENGLYPKEFWEATGYSEYIGNVPKSAEIRRKVNCNHDICPYWDYCQYRFGHGAHNKCPVIKEEVK